MPTPWSNDLDTDHDHAGRLLTIQLTRALWCLDRVPTVEPDAGRRNIQTAHDICDEVGRSFASLRVSPEMYTEVERTLDELRARLRAMDEL